jgi:hypothetical protein
MGECVKLAQAKHQMQMHPPNRLFPGFLFNVTVSPFVIAVVYWLGIAAAIGLGVTATAQELALREMLPGRGFSVQVPEGFDVTKSAEKGSISATRPSDRATFEAR